MAVSSHLDGLPWESWSGLDPSASSGVRWKLVFSAGHTPTATMSMGLAEIAPGGILPLHCHPPAEIYHVLAGEGRCEIEEIVHALRPGISLFVPAHARHRTTNSGKTPLRFLFTFPCDSFDLIDYSFLE